MDSCDLTVVDGIPCTTLRRTLCDLGSVVPPKLVRRALTCARRRGIDLATLYDDAVRYPTPNDATRIAVSGACGFPALLWCPCVTRSLRHGCWLWKQVMSTARTLPRFSGAADDRNVSFVAVEIGADRGRQFSGANADRSVSIEASEPSSPSRRPAITRFKSKQPLPARQANPRIGQVSQISGRSAHQIEGLSRFGGR
jgi:hypothetical protein